MLNQITEIHNGFSQSQGGWGWGLQGDQLDHLFKDDWNGWCGVPAAFPEGGRLVLCLAHELRSPFSDSLEQLGTEGEVSEGGSVLASERWLLQVPCGALAFALSKGQERACRGVSWWDMRQWAALLYPQHRKDFYQTGRIFLKIFIVKVIRPHIVKTEGREGGKAYVLRSTVGILEVLIQAFPQCNRQRCTVLYFDIFSCNISISTC